MVRNIILGWQLYLPEKRAERGGNMTQLELVAEIGSEAIRIAWMYLEGQLTLRELENILGEKRACICKQLTATLALDRHQERQQQLIVMEECWSPPSCWP